MAPEKAARKIRGVYEHPKGSDIWWIQYFDHGRRRRERVGRKSDAIQLYRKRKTEILRGDKLPELTRKTVTFGELLDGALEYAREEGRSLVNYTGKAELLRKAWGPLPAESITPEDIRTWIRRRDVSAASFNRYRSFISVCYREGIRAGKVRENPARLLPLKREPAGRQRFLSREEYDAVLDAVEQLEPKYVPAVVVSVHTGMRLSEQYGLTWRHVDFARRQLHAVDTKNGTDRTIPMSSVVYDALQSIRPSKPDPAKPVFPRPRGGEGTASVRWFTKLLRGGSVMLHEEKHPILGYTWHNNRHTFCSWLAIAGVPLKTIQELAGHKDISMTARYAHLSPDHKLSAIEQLVQPRTATKTANVQQKRRRSKDAAA